MKEVITVMKEQFKSVEMIFQMSRYDDKANYQNHYLGLSWRIINPIVQVGIYYLVFGIGLNENRQISGVPFIIWMLIGIMSWFFMNSCILGTSNSIYRKLRLVMKMKFPISILPTINIVSNLSSYFSMLCIVILIIISTGKNPTIYWIQYLYYFFCMFIFLFVLGLVSSTLTVLIHDYHIFLTSLLRLLFYVSGAIWDINNKKLPGNFVKVLRLNPLYYIIEGFRDSLLSRVFFWEKPSYTLFFWGLTLTLLIIGCHLHMKFRSNFIDYI